MKVETMSIKDLNIAVSVAEGMHLMMYHDYITNKAKANNYEAGKLKWIFEVTPNYLVLVNSENVNPNVEFIVPNYAGSWILGGPIVEREGIDVYCTLLGNPSSKDESWKKSEWRARGYRMGVGTDAYFGNSALEAAMRCYVARAFGENFELTKES